MTTAPTFRVRVLHAITHDGRRVLPGTVVEVPAAEAADLVRGGRAVLVDPQDLPAIARAVRVSGQAWTTPATR